jgi:hypothetical protein
MGWTEDELDRIGEAEELQIASRKADGTLRKPTTIWVVRVGSDLYVRSVNGADGARWKHAQETQSGHVSAGGVEKDAKFELAEPDFEAVVDGAYRSKYGGYPPNILGTVLATDARESTLRLVPSKNS